MVICLPTGERWNRQVLRWGRGASCLTFHCDEKSRDRTEINSKKISTCEKDECWGANVEVIWWVRFTGKWYRSEAEWTPTIIHDFPKVFDVFQPSAKATKKCQEMPRDSERCRQVLNKLNSCWVKSLVLRCMSYQNKMDPIDPSEVPS